LRFSTGGRHSGGHAQEDRKHGDPITKTCTIGREKDNKAPTPVHVRPESRLPRKLFVAARPLTSGSPPEAKNDISSVTVQGDFPKGKKKVARNLVDQSREIHRQPTIATDGIWLCWIL
jgi:hypothetical protein